MTRSNPSCALDAATHALYERVRAQAHNRELLEALDGVTPVRLDALDGLRIGLVPGMLNRDYPETGADGAILKEVAARLSIPFQVIPADGTEGIEAAADLIVQWLRALPPESRVLLFSLSKGSAEVRHAFARDPSNLAFRNVRAWVSVSGLPFGTPSAELVLSRVVPHIIFKLWFWLKRWKLEPVRELLRHRPTAPFQLPGHIQFVQVAAFPVHSDLLDRRSRHLRRRLSPYGPNDGFAVLTELTVLPGYFYPLRGADHYLRSAADLSLRITRLIGFLSCRRESEQQPYVT